MRSFLEWLNLSTNSLDYLPQWELVEKIGGTLIILINTNNGRELGQYFAPHNEDIEFYKRKLEERLGNAIY